MCGVAAIYAYHYAAPAADMEELRLVRDAMEKRGPDGSGEWAEPQGRCLLGHRRLAIIDPGDQSNQPMTSQDRNLAIVFNGEIYNHRDLRIALQRKGHVFRTDSDTEVLLALYAEEGDGMFASLRGMYAIALWDHRRRGLLLARDPYGIKPLYIADDGWTVRVASQVKALQRSKKISSAPEPAGIAGFYLFGSVPEPFTLYQEIRAIPPGTFCWISPDVGTTASRVFASVTGEWSANTRAEDTTAAPEIARAALQSSIDAHLVADVPVGLFLSSGIDSNVLLALIREARAEPPLAITLGFDEYEGTSEDEVPLASAAARHYGADHRIRRVPKRELQEDLPSILAAMDQPTIDGLNSWFVCKAARELGVKAAISGVGGDELFQGYPSFRNVPLWNRWLWLPSRVPGLAVLNEIAQAAFAPLFPRVSPKASGMLRHGGTAEGAWMLQRALYLPRDLDGILGPELAREGLRRLQLDATLKEAAGSGSPATRVAALESTMYLRNQLLRDADWAGMAHSVEVRTPLVDFQLLHSLAAVRRRPVPSPKALLLAAPAKPLPDAIAKRHKTGFTTPIGQWITGGSGASGREPWARRWAHIVAGPSAAPQREAACAS